MINLKEVITKYPNCLNDGSKFKSVLMDLYPQEKLYAGILADMMQDGIVEELKNLKTLDSLTFKNLCGRVENKHGFAHKHVEGCLNIWAQAFDLKINQRPTTPKLTPVQKTHRKTETINELHEHKYTESIIPPTCTDKGYTLHVCDCGYEYKDNFVNPKHDFVLVEYVEPSCETEGRETYKCSVCGEEKVNILPAQGHDFGKWIEAEKPTCTEKGIEVRQCSKCGKKETRSKKATGHRFSKWRVEGDFKIRDCVNCGKTEKIDIQKEREEIERNKQEIERNKQEIEKRKQEEQAKIERQEKLKANFGSLLMWILGGILIVVDLVRAFGPEGDGDGLPVFLIFGSILVLIGIVRAR